MSDTAATQKAKSRSRLRRKATSAPGAIDEPSPASPAADADVAAPPDAAPEAPEDTTAVQVAPLGQVVAFPIEIDEHELPPFDPPDCAEDIFGAAEDEDSEAPVAANHACAPLDAEPVTAESFAAEFETAESDAAESDAVAQPAPPPRDPLAGDEEGEDVFVTPEADAEQAEIEAVEPPTEVAPSPDGFLDPEEEDVFVSVDAPAQPPAPDPAEEPAGEVETPKPVLVEDDAPFDPPDEEESGFRNISLEETMGADGELLLRAPPPAEPQSPKAGLSRAPRPEPHATDQPVPAIAVHISCDRPDVGELLAGLANDRRLARAEVSFGRGGIAGAVAHCADEQPDVLILDTTLRGADMLAGLDQLAAVMPPRARIIIIGAVNDIALLRELAARGVSEYVVPPFQPVDVVRTLCGLYQGADNAHVVAVLGARGGVGASTIAQNLAWSIAERQQSNAALVDLDLCFGGAAFDLRADAAHSIIDVLKADDVDAAFDRVACDVTDRLRLFASPASPGCDLELDAASVDIIVNGMRRVSRHVVLDVPHLWSDGVKQVLARADDVIIVSSPDLASLRNTDNLLKHLKTARKDLEPLVVLSMAGVPKRPEITLKDFTEAVGVVPVVSFAYEPALYGACAMQRQRLFEAQPRSRAAVSLDALATLLTGREPRERKRPARPKRAQGAEAPAVVVAPQPAEAAAAPASEDTAAAKAASAQTPASSEEHVVLAADAPVAVAPEPDAAAWLSMFGELPSSSVSEPTDPAPEADVAPLPLIELIEPAPREQCAEIYALPATREWAETRPRRRSTGLVRTAAVLIAAVAVAAWHVEQRRATALAAEPQTAAVVAVVPAPAAADPVRDLAAQYERALHDIEHGARDEGAALLRRLADAGFPMAQYRLAKIHEQGQAGRADLALARQWTERAASAGNVQAMHDLGVYYSREETAPRDDVAAFRWFRQAADFDLRDSQYNLGVIYEQGRGVAADRAEALFWFLLAARRHDDSVAAQRASALEAELSPMHVEQARARAAAFTPRTPEPVANGVFATLAATIPSPPGEGGVASPSDAATGGAVAQPAAAPAQGEATEASPAAPTPLSAE